MVPTRTGKREHFPVRIFYPKYWKNLKKLDWKTAKKYWKSQGNLSV